MRANEFINEEAFGTSQRRAQRPGSRPARGHEPVARYNEGVIAVPEISKRIIQMQAKGMSDDQIRALLIKEGIPPRYVDQAFAGVDVVKEHGPTSKKLCLSSTSDKDLGASALASCKSQGLRARDGKKSHLIGHGSSKVRVTVGGKKIKGKAHGGPLPDYGTRKGQK
jgi:hypothetical protein